MLWSKNFIIFETLNNTEVPADPNANPPIQHLPEGFTTRAIYQIISAKLYVPAVTLSINDNIIFSENVKQGFKRTIYWNKYRFEITTQVKNNNLDYLIDSTFEILIDCLYFHSKMFIRYSFDKVLHVVSRNQRF